MILHIPTYPWFLPYFLSSLLLLFKIRSVNVAACFLDRILLYYSSFFFCNLHRHFLYKYETAFSFLLVLYMFYGCCIHRHNTFTLKILASCDYTWPYPVKSQFTDDPSTIRATKEYYFSTRCSPPREHKTLKFYPGPASLPNLIPTATGKAGNPKVTGCFSASAHEIRHRQLGPYF